MNNFEKPIARKNGLVIQELNDEVLVYDLDTNKAHCLNESAATIWKNCDGAKTIGEITKQFIGKSGDKVNDDFVWLAIDQLNDLNLLEQELKPDFKGQTRREVLRKIGLASIIALPLISTLVAPQSAFANTSCITTTNCTCSAPTPLDSGICPTANCQSGCAGCSVPINSGTGFPGTCI